MSQPPDSVTCPHCHQPIDMAGRTPDVRFPCPHCGKHAIIPGPMAVASLCPQCGAVASQLAALAGQKVRCGTCGAQMVVPDRDGDESQPTGRPTQSQDRQSQARQDAFIRIMAFISWAALVLCGGSLVLSVLGFLLGALLGDGPTVLPRSVTTSFMLIVAWPLFLVALATRCVVLLDGIRLRLGPPRDS